jgi:hypothetical protein
VLIEQNDVPEHVFEIKLRGKSDQIPRLGDIRNPSEHVLEPLFVGLMVRNENNLGRTVGQFNDLL